MKTVSAVSAIIGIVCIAASLGVHAGVVITQQESHDDGDGKPRSSTSTLMIQGNKQKMVSERATTLIDLDQGRMVMLMPATRTAMEMPLAGLGAMGQSFGSMSQNFKATGKSRSVAGYACDEYAGATSMNLPMVGAVTVNSVSCFARAAPGAAEYSAFARRMVEVMKLKSAGGLPQGVVVANETTSQPPDMAATFKQMGLTPEQIAQATAGQKKKGPQVTRSTVTSIQLQSLPADTFDIPPGYTRKQGLSPPPH